MIKNLFSLRACGIAGFLWLGSCAGEEAAPPLPGWKTLSPGGRFTLTIPVEMIEMPLKPIDAITGCYGSPTLTIRFHLGTTSSLPREWTEPKAADYVEEVTKIGGHPATLVFCGGAEGKERVDLAGVHFPGVSKGKDGATKLTVTLASDPPLDRTLARRIFTSIRFLPQ